MNSTEKSLMAGYLDFESNIIQNYKNTPIEIQSAMIWGALSMLTSQKTIDWETQKSIYGEFMSHRMKLR